LEFNENTLLGYLHSKNFKFAEIIEKLHISGKYNHSQADFTLFVPLNLNGWENVEDRYKLKQFVLFHTLERTLSVYFLKSSGAMMINTRLPGSRILVENINSNVPVLNREARVVDEIRVGNANIIVIDRPLTLDDNPMSNGDI